jgi:hypothetical protein
LQKLTEYTTHDLRYLTHAGIKVILETPIDYSHYPTKEAPEIEHAELVSGPITADGGSLIPPQKNAEG